MKHLIALVLFLPSIAQATLQVTSLPKLTGPITSIGNVTSIASQTGTGSTFVMNTSPTLVTPSITGPVATSGAQTWTSPTAVTGTVSNSASGTAVTGVSTLFRTEFHVGDNITIGGQTVEVTAVASDTAMTTATITNANSGVTATRDATPDFYVYPNGIFQSGGTRTTVVTNASNNASAFLVGSAPTAGNTTGFTPVLNIIGYLGNINATTAPSIQFSRSRGTEASPVATSSGDVLGNLNFRGYGTSFGNGAQVQGMATELWSGIARGSKLVFGTTTNATTSVGTALTLDQDKSATFNGTVTTGIGLVVTGTPPGGAGFISEIKAGNTDADGSFGFSSFFTGNASMVFSHRATSNTGSWAWSNGTAGANTRMSLSSAGVLALPGLSTSSAATTGTLCWTTGTGVVNVDTTTTCLLSTRKVKEYIEPLDSGLAEVMKLRPVSYQLKKEFNPTGLGRQIGLIAEEVALVDDRLVSKDENGDPHAVRYQQTVALLVRGMQQQQAQITELRAEIRKLKSH